MNTTPAAPAASAPSAPAPSSTPSSAPSGGAPAPSSPAPSSTPAEASPASGGGSEDVLSIFGYDPFAPPATPAAATPPAPEPPQAPPTPAAPAQDAAVPAQPGQPGLADIQASVERLASVVTQGQQPQPTGPAVDPIERVDVPSYQLEIPDALVSRLQSQNPVEFRQGVQALVQGTLQHAHQNIVVALRKEISRFLPEVIGMQVQQYTAKQQVFQDFYGKYPQLSNPALRPLVTQIGQSVAAEMKAQGWTPELRDAIGNRVMQMLSGIVPAAPQVQAPAAPSFTPTGASPAPAPQLSGFAKEFADLL